MTPLHRSTASPGHVAKMQKIFSNAQASLQLDVHYATSPHGSIESRLPSDGSCNGKQPTLHGENGLLKSSKSKNSGWRYSTLPFKLASADLDVREPLPEQSPLLPHIDVDETNQSKVFVAEPISSGFTSPVNRCHDAAMEDGPLPDSILSSPPEGHGSDTHPGDNTQERSADDLSSLYPLVTTELDEPLTNLSVSRTHRNDASNSDMEESPIVAHLKRQSGVNVDNQRLSPPPDSEIFLSTPAKAAADSAKAKRGILRPGIRYSNSKENIDPISGPSGINTDRPPLLPCPNPAAHRLCPDPTAHQAPGIDTVRTPNIPSTGLMRGFPSPSPLRASFQPPTGYVRANASGSPMPLLRVKSPSMSPDTMQLVPRQSYFSQGRQGQRRPGPPSRGMSHFTHLANEDTEHFQPGWYYAATPEPIEEEKPAPLKYSFSTAAAKVVGSSPAPDSRIRDSYRTDTLTPLAKPTSRYRKNGIGALASRGGSKYYGNLASEAGRGVKHRSRMMASGPYPGTTSPRCMSSPPQQIGGMVPRSIPRSAPPKRRRTQKHQGAIKIVEDDIRATAKSHAASLHSDNTERDGSVMEVDEDIREAVRLSIIATPDRLAKKRQSKSTTGDAGAGLRELSPNVDLFRKGSGPRRKRRTSYWDGDLEEVSRSPAKRGSMSSPLKPVGFANENDANEHGSGDEAKEGSVSFDEDDLCGEVQRASLELERRLGCVDAEAEAMAANDIGDK